MAYFNIKTILFQKIKIRVCSYCKSSRDRETGLDHLSKICILPTNIRSIILIQFLQLHNKIITSDHISIMVINELNMQEKIYARSSFNFSTISTGVGSFPYSRAR